MIISFSKIKYFNESFKMVGYFYLSCWDSWFFGGGAVNKGECFLLYFETYHMDLQ